MVKTSAKVITKATISKGSVFGVDAFLINAIIDPKNFNKHKAGFQANLQKVMKAFGNAAGDELVSSVRGGPMGDLRISEQRQTAEIITDIATGQIQSYHPFKIGGSIKSFERVESGKQYPYGILQQTTPEGEKYDLLKLKTINIRNKKVQKGQIPELPAKLAYRLLETGEHILKGLKPIIYITRNGISIGLWYPNTKDRIIAERQNFGYNGWFYYEAVAGKTRPGTGRKIRINIPPTPFLGVQEKYQDVIANWLLNLGGV